IIPSERCFNLHYSENHSMFENRIETASNFENEATISCDDIDDERSCEERCSFSDNKHGECFFGEVSRSSNTNTRYYFGLHQNIDDHCKVFFEEKVFEVNLNSKEFRDVTK
ncbi:hypothetical protein ACNO7T_22880, partial [Vibrio campbellii]